MPATAKEEYASAPDGRGKAATYGAVMVWTLCAAGFVWLAAIDLDWKRNHDLALEQGDIAKYARHYDLSRRHYEEAVRINPYSADAHLLLALLYDRRLADNEQALKHYLYARKYAPDHEYTGMIDSSIEVLERIRSGVIEDPVDALADMEDAALDGYPEIFRLRLDPALAADADSYYRGWAARGRGTLAYRRMVREGDGGWRAVLDLAYADGSVMSAHFRAVPGRPWRMMLAFP
ncbi:MAG: hypothetical protein LBJ46_04575 [Planctomycetota bacterium]|jgi:tetratricopeptide (TPR) repeat protein|nr:hypothetical protein [Planctomycetota bacterium]